MANDRNERQSTGPGEQQNSEREQTSKNPFKETGAHEPAETREEEAEAEQQRKEALTERD